MQRMSELVKLLEGCLKAEIKVTQVEARFNGYIVRFKDWDGDAAMHDGTYGNNKKDWETYGFSWDNDDVSVHGTEELLKLLTDLKNGEKGGV